MLGLVGYSTSPHSTPHWNARCGKCKRLFVGIVKRKPEDPPEQGRTQAEDWLVAHEKACGGA